MSARGLLKAAQSQLGLDDETYRSKLQLITGKTSSKNLTPEEIKTCINEFKKDGFKPTLKGNRKPLEGKYAKKLQALWIAGWNLGLIKNRDDKAMLAFIKRQTGIEHTRFLFNDDDGVKAVEGLKGWLTRAGVDWTSDKDEPTYTFSNGYKIAVAQYKIIEKLENKKETGLFWSDVCTLSEMPSLYAMKDADWIKVMNAFGKRIRGAK